MSIPSDSEIVELLSEAKGPPAAMTVREMTQASGLRGRYRPALRQRLRKLVDEGVLTVVRGRRFSLASKVSGIVGRFSRHRSGFGFVIPDDPQQSDLFIPPDAQAGALHNDLVSAQLVDIKVDGRREGQILKVLERHSRRINGLFERTYSGHGIVQPLDAGYDFQVEIDKKEIEGAKTGELVRVEIETFPHDGRPAKGRIIERLGRMDEPGVEVEVLIRKYELETEFPDHVLREVEALPSKPEDWPLDGRLDLTKKPLVTIDGETAKDFDDAVFVEKTEDGYELTVAIADVAFFVEEGSEIDAEAVSRGTSVYFPGRAVPMLPERLSNDLCSLVPGQIRLTQSTTISYDHDGKVLGATFDDSFIRSHARLTYEQVAAAIQFDDKEERKKLGPLLEPIEAAAELAKVLTRRRERRGAIDFDLPEPEFVVALTGQVEQIVARQRNDAHRLIEEFMIAANQVVGSELKKRRVPVLFRVHESPPFERLERLVRVLSGLGYRLPKSLLEIRPKQFARLIDKAKGTPEEPFVQRVVLRSMALARYDPECLGHFGLALQRYLHFTSPIRRYPDLVVHRALRRLRTGKRLSAGEREERKARVAELAAETSRLEREAEGAEREAIRWKMTTFMANRIGEEFSGRIVEVANHGILVMINEPYVEGLIPIRRLGDYFVYDERKQTLTGRRTNKVYKLGDAIDVRVDRVDRIHHFIDFALTDEPATSDDRKGRSGKRRPLTPSKRSKRKQGGRGGRRGGRR